MISQGTWLRKKILKRWAFDFLEVTLTAETRIEVILKKRAEINFLEGVFLVLRSSRGFFSRRGTFALFLPTADIIYQRNGIFQLLEDRVLHHLGSDHVLELKLVERKHADHLH